jgi:ferric-dicitrate binding protein FerR (iron transport regulator)
MKSDSRQDIFEENLSKMLNSAMKKVDSAFEEGLTKAVLTEVNKQRSAVRYRLFFKKMSFAAAAVIVIAAIWLTHQGPVESLGQVRNLYGIVTVSNGNAREKVIETADIRPEQWIETLSGSRAEILLKDKSKLLPAPRTVRQINNGKDGQQILLQRGFVAIEAAKQPLGKSLTIKTDGSQVRVLGTSLDVRLVKKPDGSKRTRVSVASGSVELESSGEKVLLPANTEGIADEGKTPVKRPSNLEVSEIVRLFNKNNELAIQSNVNAGLPAIIDFKGGSTAAVWTMVPYEKLEETGAGQYLLKLKYPASGARVFTLEGTELPVSNQGRNVQIDFSSLDVDPSQINQLVLKLPEIKGIFQSGEGSIIHFDRPAGSYPTVTLFQFRLPELASIEQIHPEPIETARKLNKLVITVATDSLMFEVCE